MLLPFAALGAYGLYHASKSYTRAIDDATEAALEFDKMTPNSGKYNPHAATGYIRHRQPRRVIPDVDLRGVPMYHIDYGSGGLTRSYTTPVWETGGYSYPK